MQCQEPTAPTPAPLAEDGSPGSCPREPHISFQSTPHTGSTGSGPRKGRRAPASHQEQAGQGDSEQEPGHALGTRRAGRARPVAARPERPFLLSPLSPCHVLAWNGTRRLKGDDTAGRAPACPEPPGAQRAGASPEQYWVQPKTQKKNRQGNTKVTFSSTFLGPEEHSVWPSETALRARS